LRGGWRAHRLTTFRSSFLPRVVERGSGESIVSKAFNCDEGLATKPKPLLFPWSPVGGKQGKHDYDYDYNTREK